MLPRLRIERARSSFIHVECTIENSQLSVEVPGCNWLRRSSARTQARCTRSSASCWFCVRRSAKRQNRGNNVGRTAGRSSSFIGAAPVMGALMIDITVQSPSLFRRFFRVFLRNKRASPAVFGSRIAQRRALEPPNRRQIMETLLDNARQAGMAVMLDACIGRERFHSIVGSDGNPRTICAALRSTGGGVVTRLSAGRRSANAATRQPWRRRSAARSANELSMMNSG